MPDRSLIIVAIAFVASCLGTLLVRTAARRAGVIDHPNERSSHTVPTARGGGLAIVIVVLAGTLVGGNRGWIPQSLVLALTVGGAAIAAIGALDDKRGVSPKYRFLVHLLAATWALWCLGGLPRLTLGQSSIGLAWFAQPLVALGIVWLTNLYNFMDGTDGLAGSEALMAGAFGAFILSITGHASLAFAPLLFAAAAAGFLCWNLPRASIFMGDVGSGFCGYYFAVLAVGLESLGAMPLVVWIVLLAMFIGDATLTLIRRVARGERWYSAHRSHAYQRVLSAGWSHARILAVVCALNVVLGLLAWKLATSPAAALAMIGGAAALFIGYYLYVERLAPMKRP